MERQKVLLLLALSETTPLTDDVMALTDDPHFWQSLMETEEADLTADQRKVLMALGVNSGSSGELEASAGITSASFRVTCGLAKKSLELRDVPS